MGRSLYRDAAIRSSTTSKKLKLFYFLLAPFIGFFFALGFSTTFKKPVIPSKDVQPQQVVRPIEAVAALGQLSPAGDVRRLAAPVSGFGGSPRVSELLVREGDVVKRGDVLAIFDNRPQIIADLSVLRARLQTLQVEIQMQEREVSRFKTAALEGAASLVLLEEKEDELIKLKGKKNESLARQIGLEADLADSALKTPIDGVILRVHTRVGERAGNEGILEVGANQKMEALIEVYESDVNRVKLGQSVSLISENGGFSGALKGLVQRISPQVRQRKVLSTDPTGDADARVVEVRVTLDSSSSSKVRHLTGMKVIARFEPS